MNEGSHRWYHNRARAGQRPAGSGGSGRISKVHFPDGRCNRGGPPASSAAVPVARERVIVVMPAYNAASTLERIYRDIPTDLVDEVIVVDDCSTDDTVTIAERLPVTLIRHERNTGYGGNQKTCYRAALDHGADYVVMLHADYQYDGRMIGPAIHVLKLGICDVILGNRIRTRREALGGGMPPIKYVANRALTLIENVLTGQNLGEWHSGFRAYRRCVLEVVPFLENSDEFVFDSQFLLQAAHFGFKIGDLPVPVRYFDEMSSISLSASARYAVQTLATLGEWYANRLGLRRTPRFRGRADAGRRSSPATRAGGSARR
jgi:glycosyltransferase involved in cell wall biosynthesis